MCGLFAPRGVGVFAQLLQKVASTAAPRASLSCIVKRGPGPSASASTRPRTSSSCTTPSSPSLRPSAGSSTSLNTPRCLPTAKDVIQPYFFFRMVGLPKAFFKSFPGGFVLVSSQSGYFPPFYLYWAPSYFSVFGVSVPQDTAKLWGSCPLSRRVRPPPRIESTLSAQTVLYSKSVSFRPPVCF